MSRDAEAAKQAIIAKPPTGTYVHLATHGFFYREMKPSKATRAAMRLRDSAGASQQIRDARNPLVESGVALAGANVRDPYTMEAKGLLKDEKLVGVDLSRCELVMLSACDTGRGEEVTWQGVMGLRAAVMAEALVRAQEAVRDDPSGQYKAPINWAAWVLAGEAW